MPRHSRRKKRCVPWKLLVPHALIIGFSLLLISCSDLYLDPYEQASITDFLDEAFAPIRLLLAIVGIALMLGGWKLYRIAVALPGFVLGASLGFVLGATENDLFAILGLIICGLIGAGLALLLHDLMVFGIGGLVGAVVVGSLWAWGAESFPPALLLLIAGLVGGIAFLFLARAAIILFSAAIGAVLFGLGINATGGWLLLFFGIGVVVQYGLASMLGEDVNKKLPGKAEPSEEGLLESDVQVEGELKRIEVEQQEKLDRPATVESFLIDLQGQRYPLFDNYLIGRGSACNMQLLDPSVSRKHAILRYAEGSWYIQDQDSAGGTFVNDQPITASQLKSGDQIQIGEMTFRFQIGDWI